MKHLFWGMTLLLLGAMPTLSHAKGAPLLLQTGDELFEVANAPKLEQGYSVGYACKRLGLFGADLWTWDCQLMAVNLDEFAVADLTDELHAELAQKYSLDDRVRDPWNHYGVAILILLLAGVAALKLRNRAAA